MIDTNSTFYSSKRKSFILDIIQRHYYTKKCSMARKYTTSTGWYSNSWTNYRNKNFVKIFLSVCIYVTPFHFFRRIRLTRRHLLLIGIITALVAMAVGITTFVVIKTSCKYFSLRWTIKNIRRTVQSEEKIEEKQKLIIIFFSSLTQLY